ncbi:nucleotidyltransferase domain-containing protein [Actinomadura madurae]|nr:nucleotidyltransferase domain-containing protein [Actinomadura madurae]
MEPGQDTVTLMWDHAGVEADAVTHDLAKFCTLLLRRNGYVLEQVMSPLVVATSPVHEELRALVPGLVTSHHAHHYLGFARNQWRLFEKSGELKPLLYTFRVLLTGVHLMRTGEVEADLTRLAGGPPYLPDLVEAKRAAEHGALPRDAPGPPRLRNDVAALTALLEDERDRSSLPEAPREPPRPSRLGGPHAPRLNPQEPPLRATGYTDRFWTQPPGAVATYQE